MSTVRDVTALLGDNVGAVSVSYGEEGKEEACKQVGARCTFFKLPRTRRAFF